jgi:hypothetical protein
MTGSGLSERTETACQRGRSRQCSELLVHQLHSIPYDETPDFVTCSFYKIYVRSSHRHALLYLIRNHSGPPDKPIVVKCTLSFGTLLSHSIMPRGHMVLPTITSQFPQALLIRSSRRRQTLNASLRRSTSRPNPPPRRVFVFVRRDHAGESRSHHRHVPPRARWLTRRT